MVCLWPKVNFEAGLPPCLAIPSEARHRQGPNNDLVLLEAPLKFGSVAAPPVRIQFIGHNFSSNDGVFFHHVTVFPQAFCRGVAV